MNRTKIEYLTHTWNPIAMRCSPISEGCAHCWHLGMAKRLAGRVGYVLRNAYAGTAVPVLVKSRLEEPLSPRDPARIGVQFMGDLFHEDVSEDTLMRVFGTIDLCRKGYSGDHIFMMLTKRPERMRQFISKWWESLEHPVPALSNLWLGVTAENQRRADERIPVLLQIPAAVRFVSVEPMLGAVDLTAFLKRSSNRGAKECRGGSLSGSAGRRTGDRRTGVYLEDRCSEREPLEQGHPCHSMSEKEGRTRYGQVSQHKIHGQQDQDQCSGSPSCLEAFSRTDTQGANGQSQEWGQERQPPGELGASNIFRTDKARDPRSGSPLQERRIRALSWVICGAETGPGARPMDLDWARSLQGQCQAAGVPFFFKRGSDGERTLDGEMWEQYPEEAP